MPAKKRPTRKISKQAAIAQERKTVITGIVLYGSILIISAFLWLFGIISFLIYMLVFVICLIGGMKNARKWNQLNQTK